MKIKKDKILGLNFFSSPNYSEIIDKIYEDRLKQINLLVSEEKEREKYTNDVLGILSREENRNYLPAPSTFEIIDNIKISEGKIDGTFFKGLPVNKKVTILFAERFFFRYYVREDSIFFISVSSIPIDDTKNEVSYNTFRINTKDGTFSQNAFEEDAFTAARDQVGMVSASGRKFSSHFLGFLRHLIFLEFSELETVFLKNGSKYGTKKQGKYVNESGNDIVIVDSTWNKTIIRVGEFGVRGHFRLQAFGSGRSSRKLIYVADFIKKGYVRNSKKQLIDG
jgi:hypothetical protein